MTINKNYIIDIIENTKKLFIDNKNISKKEIQNIKRNFCKKYNIKNILSDHQIYNYCIRNNIGDYNILKYFITKPTKTISGVATISVMTSPYLCPHGKCLPCPGGPKSKYQSPQSYLGKEPATMRAIQNNYDPYLQVYSRLKQLYLNGHDISKCELVIMGGTFSSRPNYYQEWFIKRSIEAMNNFNINIPKERKQISPLKLSDILINNEKSNVRNIHTTFETRPDYIDLLKIKDFLKFGGTKVEIGVQSVFDDILLFIKRGHDVSSIIRANKLLRDYGFNVGFHMMLGLHNGNFDKEIEEYKILYNDPNFKPDYLKIYPTLVIDDTELYDLWKKKLYKPISNEDGIKILSKIKSNLPKWTKLQRIQRDIPAFQIIDGIKKSNIRELVKQNLLLNDENCSCIRCREIGRNLLYNYYDINIDLLSINVIKYIVCNGEEFFIEIIEKKNNFLIGYCRLRFPSEVNFFMKKNIAIIREIRMYKTKINSFLKKYNGYKQLIEKAENISIENGYSTIAIVCGVGAREYYRKYNYKFNGLYMIKELIQ